MKRVALVYRPDTDRAFELASKVAKWLKKRDCEPFSFSEQKRIPGTERLKSAQIINKLDLVVVLGGDGTYLGAVRLLRGRRIPLVGINMGSLGFLTANRVQDLDEILEKSLRGEMQTRKRSMLCIQVKRGRKIVREFLALNDLVLERGSLSHLIKLSIHSEKFFVSSLKADGLIVSSPTGSTAYNLAAGGPILHPEVAAIVVTPVCPHSLTSRPLLFPDDKALTFKIEGKERFAFMTVDGQKVGELHYGETVVVHRSDKDHVILRDPDHNFFELLREKLKFGERE